MPWSFNTFSISGRAARKTLRPLAAREILLERSITSCSKDGNPACFPYGFAGRCAARSC